MELLRRSTAAIFGVTSTWTYAPRCWERTERKPFKVHAEMTEMFVYAILLGGLEHFLL